MLSLLFLWPVLDVYATEKQVEYIYSISLFYTSRLFWKKKRSKTSFSVLACFSTPDAVISVLENPKWFPVTSRFILFSLQVLYILVIKSPCEIIVLYFSVVGSTTNMVLFSEKTLRKAWTLRSASVIKYRKNRLQSLIHQQCLIYSFCSSVCTFSCITYFARKVNQRFNCCKSFVHLNKQVYFQKNIYKMINMKLEIIRSLKVLP